MLSPTAIQSECLAEGLSVSYFPSPVAFEHAIRRVIGTTRLRRAL